MSVYVGDRAGGADESSYPRRRAHLIGTALAAILATLAMLVAGHLAGGHDGALPRTGAASLSQVQHLPLPLRSQLSTAEGTAPRYWVQSAKDGTLHARGGGITTSFSRGGVSLASAHASTALSLAQVSDAGEPLALPAPLPRAHGNRVEYARGAVDEWYANGPQGLEQGFTIASGAQGMLTIALDARGTAAPHLKSGSVVLGGGLRYGGLSAVDASGRQLPSHLAVHGGRIVLEVDAAGARFPVRIDPFVFEEGLHYSAQTLGEGRGGTAISADGRTVVVGASQPAPGAVYVFQRGANGLWALQQTISPGGTDGYAFGSHVALSEEGTTLLVTAETSSNLGRIWTYTLHEGVWAPDATTVSDPIKTNPPYDHDKPGFLFGNALAVSGNGSIALVADEPQGAAVLYRRVGSEWHEVTSFSNGKSEPSEYALAIALSGSGNEAIVAAPAGALVYSYSESGGTWKQDGQFAYPNYDGQRNVAVAISREGTTAIAGEYVIGEAHVWIREGSEWAEQAALREPVGPSQEEFGSDVSLSASGSKALILAFGGGRNRHL